MANTAGPCDYLSWWITLRRPRPEAPGSGPRAPLSNSLPGPDALLLHVAIPLASGLHGATDLVQDLVHVRDRLVPLGLVGQIGLAVATFPLDLLQARPELGQ